MSPLIFFFILCFPVLPTFLEIEVKHDWPQNTAHSQLLVSAQFYNDHTKFVTGSSDNKVKIWSLIDFNLLHEEIFSDDVTHVSLHPVDNRIFILVFDGTMAVLDPNNYTVLYSGSYPQASSNGNYIQFIDFGDSFIVGGYNHNSAPRLYYFYSDNYTLDSTRLATTTFPTGKYRCIKGDEVTVMSVDSTGQILSAIPLTQSSVEVFNISSFTLLVKYTETTAAVKWIQFSPYSDNFYTSGFDGSIKMYTYVSPGSYQVRQLLNLSTYGDVYSINADIAGFLIIAVNNTILLYSLDDNLIVSQTVTSAVIFVIQVSPDLQFLAAGMANGELTLWSILQYFIIPIEEEESFETEIIIGAVAGTLCIIVAVILLFYFCYWRKKRSGVEDTNLDSSMLDEKKKGQMTNEQIIKNDQLKDKKKKDMFIPIKKKKGTESDKSSDVDYDQLMAQGHIIVIKDDLKKKKYIDHLKRQQGKKKTNDDSDSDTDYDQLMAEGTIIVIKDKHEKKKKKFAEEDDEDLDYQQLMAQGTVIVIKDDNLKKKYVEGLKKENQQKNRKKFKDEDSDASSDLDYQQLMAEETIIVIKDTQRKKKVVQILKQERDNDSDKSSVYQYDQMMAQGTIVVIKDEEKKKKYVEQLKKQRQQKREKRKNKQNKSDSSDVDYEQLMAEGNIVVIKDDTKKNRKIDQEESDPDYEQLMAEGTVIIIKDDQMKKQYIDQKNLDHQKKRQSNLNDSDISSDPDYEMIMAQGHIIIIKEDDDKKDYLNHLKTHKEEQKKLQQIQRAKMEKLKNQLKDDQSEDDHGVEGQVILIGEENLSKSEQKKRSEELKHYKRILAQENGMNEAL